MIAQNTEGDVTLRIMKLTKILASLAMFVLVTTPAHAYDVRDAAYVTSSKNVDVLFYIVCLQKRNSRQPRALSTNAALNKAVAGCQKERSKLPKSPTQPSAADIKQLILECGFQLSDASPDMDCGGSNPRVLVKKSLGIDSVLQLDSSAICFDDSSKLEKPIATYFKKNKIKYIPLALVNSTEARKSYDAGLCDALVINGADVASEISQLKAPSKHLILPDSLGSASGQTPNSVKSPGRPKKPLGTTAGGRKVRGNTPRTTKTPIRPGRPGATSQKPIKVSGTTPRRRTTTKPTRPSRPGATASTRSGFPIIAQSRGSNIRSAPRVNGKKLGSSKSGQPVTLLANVGKKYKGYPWFKIRMNNGTVGYQWGGGLCAKARTLVSGTKGTCKVQLAKRKKPTSGRPTKPTSQGGNKSTSQGGNKAADVIVSVLDLVGKIIENGNNKNTKADAAIFSQNLNVSADGPYVMATRKVVEDKEAALYTVRGKKGQVLNVDVWSPKGNVVFEIYDGQASVGGRTLRGASQDDNAQSFRDALPRNGKYQILVGSVNGIDTFELSVALDSAVAAPPPTAGPIYSGGTLALNRRAVGTYSSKTGTSGNIELNEVANALTWTTFCGPTIALSADWTNNLLLPNSGIGALVLKMSKKGKVRGFSYNGHKYTKKAGIIMPMCARPTGPSATNSGGPSKIAPVKPAPVAVIYWEDNPKDPRVKRNYNKVPNAWWGICEKENYDPNSSKFNNEKAYWDCADAGQISGGGSLTATTSARPIDPRETKDYSAVLNPAENACSINYPTSLPDDKGYYDCMDVALKVALTSRPTAPIKPTAPNPSTPDPRATKDYSKVSNVAANQCGTDYPNSPADDKGYYDCMDVALKAGPTTTPITPYPATPDPRANKDYSTVPQGSADQCGTDFPNSPADDKGYYDCMDVALKAGPTTTPITPYPATPDPRANKDYSTVPQGSANQCGTDFPNSPADDKGYYDCMDVALKAGPTTTPITPYPAAPDPRANKDYSTVPQGSANQCGTDYPNSPADDKGFYDCMDIGLNASPSGPTTTPVAPIPATPDPRANKDYSTVPQGSADQCGTDYPNSPADDKGFYDCMDLGLNGASSNSGVNTAPVNDNQTNGNDQSLAEIQNYCGGNAQCYADLESCYYQHGTIASQAFEQCAAAWDEDQNNQQTEDTQPANDNQTNGNDQSLAEIQNYCGGNTQCYANLESCYYQHGTIASQAFEQCAAAWDQDSNNQQSQDTQPANDNQSDGADPLAEIQSYCEGNDQCYADLESCYYQHGTLESEAFEQCGAAWQ